MTSKYPIQISKEYYTVFLTQTIVVRAIAIDLESDKFKGVVTFSTFDGINVGRIDTFNVKDFKIWNTSLI